METTNKTSSEILLEAADLLEQEGKWGKGAYFKQTDQGCKMCAHGAIAYCGNPEVKKSTLNNDLVLSEKLAALISAVSEKSLMPACVTYYNELARRENLTPEQWIAKHFGEVGLAHYKAFKVGLTYDFNDRSITKQRVINKLREAVEVSV